MDKIANKNAWIYFGGGMIAGKIQPATGQGYDPKRYFHIVDENGHNITIVACDVNAIRQVELTGDSFVQIWM
jgi:hypothetical protein